MSLSTRNTPPHLVRISHAWAFRSFLEHHGASGERLFRNHGLPVNCDDPNAFVPLLRVWSMFDAAARQEDAMTGWLVGRFVGDHNLSRKLLRKLENATTLYLALKRLVDYVRSEASHLEMGIVDRHDDILFYSYYLEPDLKKAPGYDVSQAYQLPVVVDLVRHFLGRNWMPPEIGIEASTLPNGLQELFPGCRILANRPMGYVAVPRCCLHLRAPRSRIDPARKSDSLVMTDRFDYVDTLVAVLKAYLPDGYLSARAASSLIGISERTLVRQLSSRGLTYGTIVDEMRFTLAAELLRETDAKIIEVALSIGFDDAGHFARMFRRVAGVSPREFREAVRLDETGHNAVTTPLQRTLRSTRLRAEATTTQDDGPPPC